MGRATHLSIGATVLAAFVVVSGCRSVDRRTNPPNAVRASEPESASDIPTAQPITETQPLAPVVPPPACDTPIDFAGALTMAGASSPIIGLAREAVAAARAEQMLANAQVLPTMHAGADFNWHAGNLQSARGVIVDVDRASVYVGAGAAAVGAGTVGVPGVHLVGHVADAIFEPQVARERLRAASFDARATSQTVLRDVGVQYFELLGAQARLQAIRASQADVNSVVVQTANFARTGEGRQSDAERAASEAELLRVQAEREEENIAVAAAELARLLSIDPTCGLRSVGDPLAPLTLIDPAANLESLVQTAVAARPEIGARSATIAASVARLREERFRPWLPLISVGYSAGGFGGGSDLAPSRFGSFSGRGDFDAMAVWSLTNLGFGNRALQRERQAEVGQAEAERGIAVNQVRREVAAALADVAAKRLQIEVAQRELRTASEGFRLDVERSRNLEGRPIEVLDSANLLTDARLAVIRAIVAFNQAQVRLLVAIGQPPFPPGS